MQREVKAQMDRMCKAISSSFSKALAEQESMFDRKLGAIVGLNSEPTRRSGSGAETLEQPPTRGGEPSRTEHAALGCSPGLNADTCPQLAAAVRDIEQQMEVVQRTLCDLSIAAARHPRVAFSREVVPRGTPDRRRFITPDPMGDLEPFSLHDYGRGDLDSDDAFERVPGSRLANRSRHRRRSRFTPGYSGSEEESDHGSESHHSSLPGYRGPRKRGLLELKPSNPLFRDALSYRRYRLRNVSQDTSYELATETGRAAAILRPVLKQYTLSGSKPASVLRFLQVFKRQCDNHKFSEGEAFLALPYFLSERATDAFESACEFGDTSSGGISNYCEAVQFLLRLFAKDRYLDDAMETFDGVRQRSDEDEMSYAQRLQDCAHDFGPVFVERDLITRFINGLSEALKPMLRAQQFQPHRGEGFHDVLERASSIGDSFRALRQQQGERRAPTRPAIRRLPPTRSNVAFVDDLPAPRPADHSAVGEGIHLLTENPGFDTPSSEFESALGEEDAIALAYSRAS